MKDSSRTKQELIEELSILKNKIKKLQLSESDRKQTEEALRKSEGNFRHFLDDSPLGMRISTSKAETIYVNQAMLDIYGYDSIEEMKRRSVKERYTPQSYAEYKIRKEKREQGELGPSEYEISIVRKNGEVRHLQAFHKEILWNGVKQAQIIYQDITERRRAEKKLINSEEKFRTLAESSSFAIMMHQGDRWIYANRAAKEISGYTEEDLYSMHFWDFVHPDHRDLVKQSGLDRQQGKVLPRAYEFKIIAKNGVEKWLSLTGNSIQYEDKPTALISVTDITERKQAEEALKNSEEKYRNILKNIEESYYEVDLTGNFTFFNDSMYKTMGYTREELMGMNNRGYTNKENAEKLFQAFNEVYRTGKPGRVVDYEIIRKDGANRYVGTSISLHKDSSGKPIGFSGIIRDTTERKRAEETLRQSEEKYRTILENIEDGYYEVDLNGKFTFFNDSACRIFGYSQEEMMGMNNRQYTDDKNLKKAFSAFNGVYKTGVPTKEFAWQIIRKDGTKRFLESSISLQKNSSGKPIGFRGIARDITDRKRMEAEILALSITDQLTGLHNRRGFLSLAGQQLKLAERNKSGMLLFFVDLDGLKWINDTLGHEEGDKALIETATVFKETFRTSDIIARLGGDEYAALTVDITEAKSELFTARLQSLIDTQNNQKNRRYRLSISVGCSYYDSENPCSLDDLMAHADKLMYEQKQNKKGILLQGASLSSSNPYTSLHDESKDK